MRVKVLFLLLLVGLVASGCAYNLNKIANRPIPKTPVSCRVRRPKVMLVKNYIKKHAKGLFGWRIADTAVANGQMILPYLKDRLPCAEIEVLKNEETVDSGLKDDRNVRLVMIDMDHGVDKWCIANYIFITVTYKVSFAGKSRTFTKKSHHGNWIWPTITLKKDLHDILPKLADDITAWLLKQGAVRPSDIAEKYRDRIIKLAEKMDTAQASTASRGGK